jgi:hypothetical protein
VDNTVYQKHNFNFNLFIFPSILCTRYGKRHVHNTKNYKAYIKKKKAIKIAIPTAIASIAANILQIYVIDIVRNKSFGY